MPQYRAEEESMQQYLAEEESMMRYRAEQAARPDPPPAVEAAWKASLEAEQQAREALDELSHGKSPSEWADMVANIMMGGGPGTGRIGELVASAVRAEEASRGAELRYGIDEGSGSDDWQEVFEGLVSRAGRTPEHREAAAEAVRSWRTRSSRLLVKDGGSDNWRIIALREARGGGLVSTQPLGLEQASELASESRLLETRLQSAGVLLLPGSGVAKYWTHSAIDYFFESTGEPGASGAEKTLQASRTARYLVEEASDGPLGEVASRAGFESVIDVLAERLEKKAPSPIELGILSHLVEEGLADKVKLEGARERDQWALVVVRVEIDPVAHSRGVISADPRMQDELDRWNLIRVGEKQTRKFLEDWSHGWRKELLRTVGIAGPEGALLIWLKEQERLSASAKPLELAVRNAGLSRSLGESASIGDQVATSSEYYVRARGSRRTLEEGERALASAKAVLERHLGRVNRSLERLGIKALEVSGKSNLASVQEWLGSHSRLGRVGQAIGALRSGSISRAVEALRGNPGRLGTIEANLKKLVGLHNQVAELEVNVGRRRAATLRLERQSSRAAREVAAVLKPTSQQMDQVLMFADIKGNFDWIVNPKELPPDLREVLQKAAELWLANPHVMAAVSRNRGGQEYVLPPIGHRWLASSHSFLVGQRLVRGVATLSRGKEQERTSSAGLEL